MFGFAASYDPDEHDRSAEQRRADAKAHLNNVEEMLDELGYNYIGYLDLKEFRQNLRRSEYINLFSSIYDMPRTHELQDPLP